MPIGLQVDMYRVVRRGGVCYRSCDGRVTLTGVSDGAIGCHRGLAVNGRRHVYCLWLLSVYSGWDSHPNINGMSVTLTVPLNNLHTVCLKVCHLF